MNHEMHPDVVEIAKVGMAGTSGSIATMALSEVSAFVSIAVGIVTFCYVAAKLYYLLKNGGKDSIQ